MVFPCMKIIQNNLSSDEIAEQIDNENFIMTSKTIMSKDLLDEIKAKVHAIVKAEDDSIPNTDVKILNDARSEYFKGLSNEEIIKFLSKTRTLDASSRGIIFAPYSISMNGIARQPRRNYMQLRLNTCDAHQIMDSSDT